MKRRCQMKRPRRVSRWACGLLAAASLVIPEILSAHSASDAYLTLTTAKNGVPGQTSIHGQWDIALRDLDFVLKLDDNGDGRITWGEVRRHSAAIETYAYRYLEFDGGPNNACAVKPLRRMVDNHADGAYVALFFDVLCTRAPRTLSVRYNLFFSIDPSHRGIFLMNAGGNVATALLAPENARIDVVLSGN